MLSDDGEGPFHMTDSLSIHYEELEIGQVLGLGVCAIDEAGLDLFVERFLPGWDRAYGAPDALIYALWSRLFGETSSHWAGFKVLGVDGLRYLRNPPGGELLRGRLTVVGKDPVGDSKGIIVAQQDLLDEAGRLVFSCMTRGLVTRR